MRLRICVVTGTRAEYGLLRPVLRALHDDARFELQLVVTGAHLVPEFGLTVTKIEADGFPIAERVEMLLASDSSVGVTTSLGLATIGFAGSFARLEPQVVMVLGDRYEILAVAQAALIARLPVVHLSGGDITEGAIDDAIRHAITKLSHVHFPFSQDSADRIIQMGEDPARVTVTGSPGLDELLTTRSLSREELGKGLGIVLRARNLLVTYHPATLADEQPGPTFRAILQAIERVGDDVGVVITLPNADTNGRPIIEHAREYARSRENVCVHGSLGQHRYYSCLMRFDAMVGNSSSGLSEAPVVGLPAVNVGARQRGRLRASTTIDATTDVDDITEALERALAWTDAPTSSPYGDGHATDRIIDGLALLGDPRDLLIKTFHRS